LSSPKIFILLFTKHKECDIIPSKDFPRRDTTASALWCVAEAIANSLLWKTLVATERICYVSLRKWK